MKIAGVFKKSVKVKKWGESLQKKVQNGQKVYQLAQIQSLVGVYVVFIYIQNLIS